MFYIDPDLPFACPICGERHGGEDTLFEMETQVFAYKMARQGIATEHVIRAPKANRVPVPFDEMELEAALALADDALSLVPEMQAIIGPTLRDAMRAEEVYEAMEEADRKWRQMSFGQGTADRWEEAITLAVATGVTSANIDASLPREFRRSVIDGMTRSAKYYSNEFFNRQVMPAVINAVEQVAAGNAVAGEAGFRAVQSVLNTRLKSVPYWRVVANAAASRSYHYGLLRTGLTMQRFRYRFQAILDNRTSEICRSLNGMEWMVSDAISLIERIADAENPDEVRNIAPWLKASDVQGLSAGELRDMGVMVPPLHGNCRSLLALV